MAQALPVIVIAWMSGHHRRVGSAREAANSAGLRALLLSVEMCHRSGGRLAAAALRRQYRTVMQVSGSVTRLESPLTEDAAIEIALLSNPAFHGQLGALHATHGDYLDRGSPLNPFLPR